ncbi:MAG: lytic transglycosylase domain-containing protein [Candidatus Eremiobacteraeota bacterium]|nr:lytic transglycosylase domain-containing protein [Candidatus Eremiobacteraeota bacterium]
MNVGIFSDIASVQQRIASIVGAAQPAAPVAPPVTPAASAGTGVDGLPLLSPGSGPFAALVQAALEGQGGASAAGIGALAAANASAPAPVPPAQISALAQGQGSIWGVDPKLITAVIANESGFNANATSKVGAQGLMQLMPATARSLGVSDPFDPAQNVAGGTRYLRGLLDRFHGDTKLAVAAYNAGPGAVERYGGVPPYPETQNYVQNVLSSYQRYQAQGLPGQTP